MPKPNPNKDKKNQKKEVKKKDPAVGGNLLAGDIGTLAGFSGKKGKKNHWRCNECGNTFKK